MVSLLFSLFVSFYSDNQNFLIYEQKELSQEIKKYIRNLNIKYYNDRLDVLACQQKLMYKKTSFLIAGIKVKYHLFWSENDEKKILGYCFGGGGANAKYFADYSGIICNHEFSFRAWLDENFNLSENDWGVCGNLAYYYNDSKSIVKFIDNQLQYCSLKCGVSTVFCRKYQNYTLVYFLDDDSNFCDLNNEGIIVSKIISTKGATYHYYKNNLLNFKLNNFETWREDMISDLFTYITAKLN